MRKIVTKKLIKASALLFTVALLFAFIAEQVFAVFVTDGVTVTLVVDEGISITDGANSTMAPTIGIASNSSIGSSAWTVRTNAAAGYTLAVKASASPALVSGGNSFADYTEASAGEPETWSVPGGSKEFGYSAYGTDTPTGGAGGWGTALTCGSGGLPDTTGPDFQEYVGFTTSDKTIATRATVTPSAGIATTICFAAEQDTIFAAAGTYTATITATATTL